MKTRKVLAIYPAKLNPDYSVVILGGYIADDGVKHLPASHPMPNIAIEDLQLVVGDLVAL
jgi:hypothetical protein